MIRPCKEAEIHTIYEIINQADEPYMTLDELWHEVQDGVVFWCLEQEEEILGVIGIQGKGEVTLIRHAYVRPRAQKMGIGTQLLRYMEGFTANPILIGAWADASWAIAFYEKNGYRLVSKTEKNRLLKKYWSIPKRQVETSVVFTNRKALYPDG